MKRFYRPFARVLAVAIALTASSAQAEFHTQVVNGHNATPGAWPFMVALIDKEAPSAADGQFCGGSLIGPQHILTAAHCVVSSGGTVADPRSIVAKIGGGDLTFGPVIGHEIIGITPHPRFDRGTMSNDLAILKLKEPVTNTPLALALAEDSALYTEGTSATVLGYGAADSTLPILPFVLQEAAIPMVSDQTCMNEIGRYFNPETQVCAGVKASSATAGDGVDSCFGDSGGPLVVSDGTGHYKQVGVVSWGLGGCAGNKARGIYSKVIANEDFVISFPMAKPMADDLPRIQLPESLSAGSEVRCVTPTLYGDTPAELTYRWYPYSRTGPLQIAGHGDTYTVRGDEAYLSCSVEASNYGGSTGELLSQTIELPYGMSTKSDNTAPIGQITGLACSENQCRFGVIAEDDLSGVLSVSAVVRVSYVPKAVGKTDDKRAKKVYGKRTVRVKQVVDVNWLGHFRIERNVRQRVKVTLIVRDRAGNVNYLADAKATTALGH